MTDAIPCGRIMRGMREPQEEAAGNEDYHEIYKNAGIWK